MHSALCILTCLTQHLPLDLGTWAADVALDSLSPGFVVSLGFDLPYLSAASRPEAPSYTTAGQDYFMALQEHNDARCSLLACAQMPILVHCLQLNNALKEHEKGDKDSRLVYLALPPSVYPQVCKGIHDHCFKPEQGKGFFRVVIEKPFGKVGCRPWSRSLQRQMGLARLHGLNTN